MKRFFPLSVLLVFCAMSFFPGDLSAGEPQSLETEFTLSEWNVSSGLPSDLIISLTQTRDGYLWILSGKKLVRYDGHEFKTVFEPGMNDPDKLPLALEEDSRGFLWLRCVRGLFKIDGRIPEFHSHAEIREDASSPSASLPSSNESLPVFGESGFRMLELPEGLRPDEVSAFKSDSVGNHWIGFVGGGLWVVTGKDRLKVGGDVFGSDTMVSTIFEDSDGMIWVGTNKGLYSVSKSPAVPSYEVHPAVFSSGEPPEKITAVVQDSSGFLWVGTDVGLFRIAKGQNRCVVLDHALRNTHILSLYIDREGSLWAGTRGKGLKQFRKRVFSTFIPGGDVAHHLQSIYQGSHGTIWISSNEGRLYRFTGRELQEIDLPEDIFDGMLFSIGEAPDGSLLFGTEKKGLFQMEKGRVRPYNNGVLDIEEAVVTLFSDSHERLWVGRYQKELGYFEGKEYRTFLAYDDYPGKMVFAALEDSRGNIWFGGAEGVVLLPGGVADKQQMRRFLREVPVSSIVEDQEGFLWMGTYGMGLIRFDPRTEGFERITEEKGLGTDDVYRVLLDGKGYFWLTSKSGIFRTARKDINSWIEGDTDRITAAHFGLSDGLKSLACSVGAVNSAILTEKGNLFFATKEGVSIVDPRHVEINHIPPVVVFDRVEIDGKEKNFGPETTSPLDVFSRRRLKVVFKAVSLIGAQDIPVRYRLMGKDREWISVNDRETSVTFPALSPGDYTLQVSAANSHGVWNPEGASLSIHVKPVFTQTILFKGILLFTAAFALIIMVLQGRRRALKDKTKYRKTRLSLEASEMYRKRVSRAFEEDKAHLNNDLSIQVLAEKLSIPPHHLSQVINEKFGKNFYDLVNTYRINEAKRKLLINDGEQPKILAIALDVGFNSLGSFNRVFKKLTGKTPSEFRTENKESTTH